MGVCEWPTSSPKLIKYPVEWVFIVFLFVIIIIIDGLSSFELPKVSQCFLYTVNDNLFSAFTDGATKVLLSFLALADMGFLLCVMFGSIVPDSSRFHIDVSIKFENRGQNSQQHKFKAKFGNVAFCKLITLCGNVQLGMQEIIYPQDRVTPWLFVMMGE